MAKKFIPLVAMLTLIVLLLSGLPGQRAEASPDWWDTDWQYRQKLTFSNSGLGPLDDFPVLVKLTPGRIDYSKTKAGGADIRFVDDDDATELAYEIEEWNPGGDSWIWVKVLTIDDSDTDYMYMYYGNPGASDGQNPTAVWDNNFMMVQHLHETSRTTGSYNDHLDSTQYGNDGEAYITPETNMNATGNIDGADDFDGTDDYIDCGNDGSLTIESGTDTDAITLEMWVKLDTVKNALVVDKSYSESYYFYLKSNGAFEIGSQTALWEVESDAGELITGTWYHLAGTFNEATDTGVLYKNGIAIKEDTTLTPEIGASTAFLAIGAYYAGGFYFDGIIDEVRISDIARSEDWIEAQYLSMTDAFITYGGEEEPPPPPRRGVGGEVHPINKALVLMPWIGLALALILAVGGGALILRRR